MIVQENGLIFKQRGEYSSWYWGFEGLITWFCVCVAPGERQLIETF